MLCYIKESNRKFSDNSRYSSFTQKTKKSIKTQNTKITNNRNNSLLKDNKLKNLITYNNKDYTEDYLNLIPVSSDNKKSFKSKKIKKVYDKTISNNLIVSSSSESLLKSDVEYTKINVYNNDINQIDFKKRKSVENNIKKRSLSIGSDLDYFSENKSKSKLKISLNKYSESSNKCKKNSSITTEKVDPKFNELKKIPTSGLLGSSSNFSIHMKYVEDNKINKFFDNLEQIGKGGFGLVMKARHIFDDKFWAIKVVKLNVSNKKDLSEHPVIKEVKTMIKLDHKNVVRYVTCWFQSSLDGLEDKIAYLSNQNVSGLITNREDTSKFNNTFWSQTKSLTSCKKNFNNNVQQFNKVRLGLDSILSNNTTNSNNSELNSCVVFVKEDKDRRKDSTSTGKKKNIESLSTSFNNHNNSNFIPSKENIDAIEEETENTIATHQTQNNCSQQKIDIVNIWDDEEESDIKNQVEIKCDIENKENSNLKPSEQDDYLLEYTTLYFFMQMEFCDGLTLDKYLESKVESGMPGIIIFSFLKQLLIGVSHMHKSKVIHRDLKYFFYLDPQIFL